MMKVGDLVRSKHVDTQRVALITKIEQPWSGTTGRWYYILYPDSDRSYPFRVSQLEKV